MIRFLLIDMLKRIKNDEITAYAAQTTYFLILSIFPFLIFFITVMGRMNLIALGINEFTNTLSFVPTEIATLLDDVLADITAVQTDTIASVSIIITVYSASRGVRAIMRAMNKAFDLRETRGFLQKMFISFVYTLGLALIIVIALALVVFGKAIGGLLFGWLGISRYYVTVWNLIRLFVPILLTVVVLAFIYRATPNVRLKFKNVLPGTLFATCASFIASYIFSYYINNFGNYSVVYGSIGSIIVLLLWLYIISIILILGGEVNASFKKYKELQ